jgi:hypothetical protein
MTIAGTVVDGIFYGATNALETCMNQETGEWWGKTENYVVVSNCDTSKTCGCATGNDDLCYVFDLSKGGDCGQILYKVPALLLASMICCLILLVVSVTYSIFTCTATCCDKPSMNSSSSSSSSSSSAPSASAQV